MEVFLGLIFLLMITLVINSLADYILEKTTTNLLYAFWSVGIFVLFCLFLLNILKN